MKDGQTEEDQWYGNNQGSPAFEEFLDWIAERVALKEWNKFRGGLNVTSTHITLSSLRLSILILLILLFVCSVCSVRVTSAFFFARVLILPQRILRALTRTTWNSVRSRSCSTSRRSSPTLPTTPNRSASLQERLCSNDVGGYVTWSTVCIVDAVD